MPTRQEKDKMLIELREKLEKSQSVVIIDYRGLNVAAMTKLRRRLKENGCELLVAKNTLTKIAAGTIELEGMDPYLEGPTAMAFGYEDPVAPAKVLAELAREFKTMQVKAGVLERRVIDNQGVKALADLPSREVLLSKVLGGMQSPMYGFAVTLNGLLRNFAYVLEAVRKQKAGEPAA